MASPRGAIPVDVNMALKSFDALPIELNQRIAIFLESDKDIVSFNGVCRSTHDAIDADACSFWRRRFKQEFETPSFKLTGRRKEDGEKYRSEYQTRKMILNVIEPVFQKHGVKPKLRFHMGTTRIEKIALRVLKDLIIDSFSDKKDASDVTYDSKNLEHVQDLVNKTNLLQIAGLDVGKRQVDPNATSFLYAIQCLLAAEFLSINDWHYNYQFGFHDAQISAYANDITAPIFTGHQRFNIDMQWLLRNLQFWRHHFLVRDEPLSPAFEALDDSERPQFWGSKLSGSRRQLGSHWKGSYAFVDRGEVKSIRLGRSGQSGHPHIADQLNGEDDPFGAAFQDLELAVCDPAHNAEWPTRFEKILHSRDMPLVDTTPVTRAQRRSHGANTVRDFQENSVHFEGDGSDNNENFYVEGWLNPLPPQHGIPGWTRMTMMKYFMDEDTGAIDIPGLWAYEGVMLPGGKIMVGRWWCPQDGFGAAMYSGPFILWNVDGSEDDEDDECIGCDRAPKDSA